MSKALVNRSLTTVKTELEFLVDSGVITQQFYDTVKNSLPERYSEGAAPAELSADGNRAAASTASLASEKPPAPPSYSYSSTSVNNNEEWVEALYDYPAQLPEDLPLTKGDRVRVLEKPNPNWTKGTCNGRTGMFPSNYTKPVAAPNYSDDKSRSSVAVPFQYQQQPPAHYQSPQQHYQSPQQQYQPPVQYQPPQQQYQPPAPFPPQSTGYYQQPQEQQQQQPQGEGHVMKIGKKFGNAAIFGAGATAGSDLINSIF